MRERQTLSNLERRLARCVVATILIGFNSSVGHAQNEPSGSGSIDFFQRPGINSVSLRLGRSSVVFTNGRKEADYVLVTHSRRDIVEAGRTSIGKNTKVIAPKASQETLETADDYWTAWWDKRFNYYGQQVTKATPLKSLTADRYVAEGDEFEIGGVNIRLLDTPGFSRDGTTYLVETDSETTVAVTGDLLWQGGRVFDLYSFQDAIPEAKIGGYHGYGARFATWIASLEKLKAENVHSIVPARGPIIHDPATDIDMAIKRIRKIYRNYLSTNALHWYFGQERMNAAATRTLGENHGVKGMPLAEHVDLPEWCQHVGTTKLLVSESGHGFALDVGGKKQLDSLKQFVEESLIKKLEGIFVTHLHNDHSAFVGEAQREFGCPVYAVPEVSDALLNPGHWFLPGLSPNAVAKVETKQDGETMKWREFDFTFHFYPGQMHQHGALLVQKADHNPVFFIGDSFSPTGIDDYCMMNRNLMREDTGYALCFQKLKALPEGSWIVNQHIPHLFRFNQKELKFLETAYEERRELISQMTPWDDPNYAIDENWAAFYPYGQIAKAGDAIELEMKIWNHSTKDRDFTISLSQHSSLNLELPHAAQTLKLGARKNGALSQTLTIPKETTPGVYVISARIKSRPDIHLNQWCEALIKVE